MESNSIPGTCCGRESKPKYERLLFFTNVRSTTMAQQRNQFIVLPRYYKHFKISNINSYTKATIVEGPDQLSES